MIAFVSSDHVLDSYLTKSLLYVFLFQITQEQFILASQSLHLQRPGCEAVYPVGLYGWRKRCLYFFLLLLLVTMIVNLALSVWIIKVMNFSMGPLKCVGKKTFLATTAWHRLLILSTTWSHTTVGWHLVVQPALLAAA
ncbi:hypothetical protein AMECASPLE_029294 [Ameca splendens]|uniref:Uncharacterized protein n=1 Tax=Ameca splendens TaxID=208324 RepID=A0ABV0ZRI6_9TELE